MGSLLLVLGVILVAAGIVVMTVIVPSMKRLPDDVDTVRNYDGTLAVLLNPATFEFMRDLDVTIERHVTVEDTQDDVALVREALTMTGDESGAVLQTSTKHHALNRETMAFADDYPDEWANLEGFAPRQGLIIGWPIGAEQKDYQGWSDDYGETVTLAYEDTVEHEGTGVETYHYVASSPARPIVPPAVAAMGLPPSMTEEQFTGLVAGLDINPAVKMALPLLIKQTQWPDEAGSAWPEPLNLVYYYEYTGDYWVEPDTGVLIDTRKTEIRSVGLEEELLANLRTRIAEMPIEVDETLLDELLPLPVFHLDYQATPESADDAAADAQDAEDTLNLYGQTLPIGAIVLGAVLGLLGLILVMRR